MVRRDGILPSPKHFGQTTFAVEGIVLELELELGVEVELSGDEADDKLSLLTPLTLHLVVVDV